MRTSARIIIYLDEEEYFISNDFEIDTRPQNLNISLTDVEIIRIRWVSEGTNVWKDWGSHATLFDAVFQR